MQLKKNMNLGIHKLLIIFFFTSSLLKAEPISGILANIQILDKITAEVKNVNVEVNKSIQYETLRIEIYACFKRPPEEIPENYVLLKIYDDIQKLDDQLIYQGWMISSSPEVTPLEHPIYDLWLKDCKIE